MNCQYCKYFCSDTIGYYGDVQKDDLPQDNLARNLRHLMQQAGHSQAQLSRLTGGAVSQASISTILLQTRHAGIDTADALAKVYGLRGWHLISPTLIADLETSPSLRALIENYRRADDPGRKIIEQVAERAAGYKENGG